VAKCFNPLNAFWVDEKGSNNGTLEAGKARGGCGNRFDENPRKLLSRQTHVCSITNLKSKRYAESGKHLWLPEASVIFLTLVVAGNVPPRSEFLQRTENSEVYIRSRRISRSLLRGWLRDRFLTILESRSPVCLTVSVIASQVTTQNSKIDYLNIS